MLHTPPDRTADGFSYSSFIVLPRLADVLDGCINCYEGARLWAAWDHDVTSSSQVSQCKPSFPFTQTGSGPFGMPSIHCMGGAPQPLRNETINVGYAQSGTSADYLARPRTTAKARRVARPAGGVTISFHAAACLHLELGMPYTVRLNAHEVKRRDPPAPPDCDVLWRFL